MKLIAIVFCVVLSTAYSYENSDIKSARIETCRGCSLNRLPEVKDFVMNDAPKYDRVEVKFITGANPELVMLGEADQELDRIPLSHLKREECNDLLKDRGFIQKPKQSEL
ncbi:selenoprotein M-like [Plodia interpunctella]|uniref:selenoprotein M-like n=1 Tax=Plodia interpunctella TaxID=58824 RepID=UPI0023682E6D|nr:selenoprotein M-like [Plodia interpunctella]